MSPSNNRFSSLASQARDSGSNPEGDIIYTCKYCGKPYNKRQPCASHERLCKLNPNFEKVRVYCSLGGKSVKHRKKYIKERKTYNVICLNCGKPFTVTMLESEYKKKNGKFYCSRHCANRRIHSAETREKITKGQIRYLKESGHIYPEEKYCRICHTKMCRYAKSNICWHCITTTDEGRAYLSSRIKGSGAGGYKENAPGGIKGKYKGIHCDSTWELAYLIYQLDHGVNIVRNTDGFKYIYNNEVHTYYPDFKEGNTYIEIKGRKYPKWKYKLEQFPKNIPLQVIYRADIQPYIQYVKSKYGTDLRSLYDK